MLNNIEFPLQQWITACPKDFHELKKKLQNLGRTTLLTKSLDELVWIIRDCEQGLITQPTNTYLTDLKKQCYQLAGIIIDNPRVNFEELLLIYAKRRIDPSYLPNHLVSQPIPHLTPKYYLETLIDKQIAHCEKKLRKKYQAEKKLTEEKMLQNNELLEVKTKYYQIETLPQIICSLKQIELPNQTHLARLFSSLEASFQILDEIKESREQMYNLKALKADLKRELAKIKRKVDGNGFNQPDPNRKDQLYWVSTFIQQTEQGLMEIVNQYSTTEQSKNNLKPLRKAIKKAIDTTVGSDFMKLAYCHYFREKHPKYFEPTNRHLAVSYFNADQREPYRIHLFNGKFYRIQRDEGNIKLIPFHSTNNCSHEKEGWVSFVMNANGEIFASSHSPKVIHSSFMRGDPVIFAGEMKIDEKGSILGVSNYSGHYEPPLSALLRFGNHLFQRQVNIENCDFYEVDRVALKEACQKLEESGLTASKIEKCKEEIWKDCQKLKLSTRYRFKENGFIKVPTIGEEIIGGYKKIRELFPVQQPVTKKTVNTTGIRSDTSAPTLATTVKAVTPDPHYKSPLPILNKGGFQSPLHAANTLNNWETNKPRIRFSDFNQQSPEFCQTPLPVV
jgi:hypothetical protein